MSRKKFVRKRKLLPDPIYNSELVTRFVNRMMKDGKKGTAERIFYRSMELIKDKTKTEGIEVFNKAIANVRPEVEVKSKRVGGAVYQVPLEVAEARQLTLAVRWLVNFSRARPERTMVAKLSAELIDAHNNTGSSIRKKEEIFKTAESNKAFAHYRW